MPTLIEEIDAAAWSRMFNAYRVATDTPEHLKALMSDDPGAHRAAVAHLFSAEIHQGTPWPSTPATAVFVARMLAEGLVRDPDLQVSLLRFLRAVGEAGGLGERPDEARAAAYPADDSAINAWLERYLTADEETAEALWADDEEIETADLIVLRAAVDCHDAMPMLLELILPLADAPEPQVRMAALSAAAVLARHPGADAQRSRLIDAMTESARDQGTAADDRAALVMCIGELGGTPYEFIFDPWLIVRGCAVLAPALAAYPDALEILAELIAAPRAFDLGFTRRPDQFTMWPRFSLIAAACAQIADEALLIPGIVALEPRGGWFLNEAEIEPYLNRFFAEGMPVLTERTHGQCALARVIARSDGLWAPTDGNRGATFARLNLPDDQAAWRELADSREHIEVVPAALAPRRRPEMYFGKAGTDPGLPDAILDLLAHAYHEAVDEGVVRAFAISIAATEDSVQSADLSFTLRVCGHELPVHHPDESGYPTALTHLMAGYSHERQPLNQLALTAAMCAKATATAYRDGRAFSRHFGVTIPLGPVITAPAPSDAPPDGYHIAFELDRIQLPAEARLTPRDLHRGPA